MAPSSGHLLLPKLWRVARFAFEKATRAIKARAPEPPQPSSVRLQPAYARVSCRQHPINRVAAIRQTQSRYFSTARAAARFTTRTTTTSQIGTAVKRLTALGPFASTLRPNLTGGALCRTAGGYSIGAGRIGGARYFSSSPACPAQVVQNVSAAVRAFWLSGQRARFDGVDQRTGAKQYRAVTVLQEQAEKKMRSLARSAPGSHIDFRLPPTITALGCLGTGKGCAELSNYEGPTLNTPGLLDVLSGDFARALKELAAVLNDLKRLSALGDLPLSLHENSIIRVRFPGCDTETVERLCVEVGVTRGVIYQDPDFDSQNGVEMALLFPFAPSRPASETDPFFFHETRSAGPDKIDWRQMMFSDRTDIHQSPSPCGHDFHLVSSLDRNPWTKSLSGYSSFQASELGDREFFPDLSPRPAASAAVDYEGIQGIYKFLEECNRAAR